eukprot:TRINITY_DN66928_c5_g9_i1.p1 TRINITY_DN66928_c5_g9~~TRINITY_DN66928_c5_g9_i1.p1  ORF type:complete len:311 (+),score=28.32 TRINITY_DN66928_c5_g9_i1:141-935(+)
MEDAHTATLQLEGAPDGYSFFAVYDGHCGPNTARYCGEHLHKRVVRSKAFPDSKFRDALKDGFLGIDEDLKADSQLKNDGSGCTAVTALVTGTEIYCGNAGDSRCVLCRGGKAIPLSQDHKPNLEGELRRITKAGSFVSNGRVNGNLSLSRAIGDFEFKQNKNLPPEDQAISANPDVTCTPLTDEDEFLVLACDGVWDVMSNEEVVDFVRTKLLDGCSDLAQICENIFDKCLAPSAPGLGCDNMTMVVVLFFKNWKARHKTPFA